MPVTSIKFAVYIWKFGSNPYNRGWNT